jgi:hypothetical protein
VHVVAGVAQDAPQRGGGIVMVFNQQDAED